MTVQRTAGRDELWLHGEWRWTGRFIDTSKMTLYNARQPP